MIKTKYKYLPRRFVMNRNEYEFFKKINSFLNNEYLIIPQVHLDELVKPINGLKTSRIFSFRHINQKSVDFVILKKTNMQPLLIIELDDKSHETHERKDRDMEVERILTEAGLAFLRFTKNSTEEEIKEKIYSFLN